MCVVQGKHLDKYLALEGMDPAQCWRSEDGVRWNKPRLGLEPKHFVSFVELIVKKKHKDIREGVPTSGRPSP